MANIRTVSSLGEVNGALQEMGINTIDQAHQVQFRLHKQTSLKEATEIKMMIQTGRHGFSIAELKDLMLSTDDQIPHIGPEVHHRNRGVQQMLYPNPPFPIDPDYEFGTPQQRVPYQAAYTTGAERNDAVSRDKRAQRAVWNTNLRLLEVKKSALEKKKTELERCLKAEFKKVNEQQSDLGVGYANYQSPYQA